MYTSNRKLYGLGFIVNLKREGNFVSWPGGWVYWSIVPYTKKIVGLILGELTYLSLTPIGECKGGNQMD